MPLALSANALRGKLSTGSGRGGLTLTELPAFVKNELGLSGLLITTDLLAGADRARLNHILECADKAGCPVLAMAELTPQNLGDERDAIGDAAIERCLRVAQAAHWMGCSSFAVPVNAKDDDDTLDIVAERLKCVARRAEKLDLNLCIAPHEGLTKTPERVGELLKRIGGFRIGTMPDFAAAAASGDGVAYLRRLVPYAGIVLASGVKFEPAAKTKSKKHAEPSPGAPVELAHTAYDLGTLASVLISVGYEGPVAIDVRDEKGMPLKDAVPAILHVKGVLERLATKGLDEDLLLDGIMDDDGELAEDKE